MNGSGIRWKPREFIDFDKDLDTSAGTASIQTDQGPAYIKALGNRSGPHVLAAELVGTTLAGLIGLRTFDSAIMNVTEDDEIPFRGGSKALAGPAFVTRKEEGHTWDGSAEQLAALENPEDIALLVVFDTWTLNCDRHLQTRRPKYDNVFLSSEGAPPARMALKAMDHTHCFTCGGDITSAVGHIDRVRDDRVYGLFPEFLPYLSRNSIRRALRSLTSIAANKIEQAVAAIPMEWEVDDAARLGLTTLIRYRADYIVKKASKIIRECLRSKRLGPSDVRE
jgi:hypothetical protein